MKRIFLAIAIVALSACSSDPVTTTPVNSGQNAGMQNPGVNSNPGINNNFPNTTPQTTVVYNPAQGNQNQPCSPGLFNAGPSFPCVSGQSGGSQTQGSTGTGVDIYGRPVPANFHLIQADLAQRGYTLMGCQSASGYCACSTQTVTRYEYRNRRMGWLWGQGWLFDGRKLRPSGTSQNTMCHPVVFHSQINPDTDFDECDCDVKPKKRKCKLVCEEEPGPTPSPQPAPQPQPPVTPGVPNPTGATLGDIKDIRLELDTAQSLFKFASLDAQGLQPQFNDLELNAIVDTYGRARKIGTHLEITRFNSNSMLPYRAFALRFNGELVVRDRPLSDASPSQSRILNENSDHGSFGTLTRGVKSYHIIPLTGAVAQAVYQQLAATENKNDGERILSFGIADLFGSIKSGTKAATKTAKHIYCQSLNGAVTCIVGFNRSGEGVDVTELLNNPGLGNAEANYKTAKQNAEDAKNAAAANTNPTVEAAVTAITTKITTLNLTAPTTTDEFNTATTDLNNLVKELKIAVQNSNRVNQATNLWAPFTDFNAFKTAVNQEFPKLAVTKKNISAYRTAKPALIGALDKSPPDRLDIRKKFIALLNLAKYPKSKSMDKNLSTWLNK